MQDRIIHLLESTLRDGSYQIDFGFSEEDTAAIAADLDRAGLPLIEVGHGLGLLGRFRPDCASAATDEAYIDAARGAVRRAKLGVFAIPGIATVKSVVDAARRGIDYLRIGVVAGFPERAREMVETCLEQGVEPFVFFMQTSLVSPQVIAEHSAQVAQWGVKTLYVVDSAGFMMPQDVTAYIRAAAESGVEVGFHGHNNLHMVMANVIAAIESGATLIDCSLRGLGRSSGNPQTEALLLVLRRLGYETQVDLGGCIAAADKHIRQRIPGHGNDGDDMLLGYAGVHSRFLGEAKKISVERGLSVVSLLTVMGDRRQATDQMSVLVDVADQLAECR